LPFWLAELVNHIVFIVLPSSIIVYPLLQALPGFRSRRMQNKINRLYSDLKSFEQELLIQIKESSVALAMQVLDKVEPAQASPGDEKPPKSELLL